MSLALIWYWPDGGNVKAYELILVTDVGIVTKIGGNSALFYVFDALDGKPRAEAKVKYQYRYYGDNGYWFWEEGQGFTDSSGLLKISLRTSQNKNYNNQKQFFTVVASDDMQAFSQGNYYAYYNQNLKWRLYAYSDRPAYRPNEKVSFKGTVRGYDDQTFHTPSGKIVQARIFDARGNKVHEKKYTLNDFGTFHDELTLDEKAVLGEYRMELYSEDWKAHLGSTPLYRLEEYKLPEFLVNVKPKPKEDGSTTYQLGDQIDVEVDAQYYFGGAVGEAEVELFSLSKSLLPLLLSTTRVSMVFFGSTNELLS